MVVHRAVNAELGVLMVSHTDGPSSTPTRATSAPPKSHVRHSYEKAGLEGTVEVERVRKLPLCYQDVLTFQQAQLGPIKNDPFRSV